MATTHEHVIEMLRAIPGYVELFAKAFPDDPDPVNIENVTDSIALLEATLITPNAPFDRYLRCEEDALTPEQQKGLQIFVDNGCASCHSGINRGGDQLALRRRRAAGSRAPAAKRQGPFSRSPNR